MSKNQKKAYLFFALAISVVGVIIYVRSSTYVVDHVVYKCADEKTLDVTYYKKSVMLHLDQRTNVFLKKNLSNDQASQYISKSENMTFWTNGKFVIVEEGNNVPYYECSVDGPSGDGLTTPSEDIPSDQVQIAPEVPTKPTPSTPVTKVCYKGGCSGQICSDKPDAVSTCEWTEAYACYKTATCEVQRSGECGWTESSELSQCLEKSKNI